MYKIQNQLNYFFVKVKFIKTTSYAILITSIRLSCNFGVNKFLAIFLGPTGIALLASYTNFLSISLSISSCSINTGVIKFSSEYLNDKVKSMSLYSTALKTSVILTSFSSIVLVGAAPLLSQIIFKNDFFTLAIRILGFASMLIVLNSVLLAILNGRGQIEHYTIINITGSVVNFILILTLTYFFNLKGALIAITLIQAIIFFVALFFVTTSDWFDITYFVKPLNIEFAKKLLLFSLITTIQQLVNPFSNLIIQNEIVNSFGLQQAGLWRSILRVSDGFYIVLVSTLNIYYLPKLSSIKYNEIRSFVFFIAKRIIPAAFILGLLIILFRFQIINILFTSDFSEMESLFLWQIIGIFLKISSWLIGTIMIAKEMFYHFIFVEIISAMFFILLSNILMPYYGVIGVTYAFAINSFIYFLIMIYFFKDIFFKSKFE